MLALAALSAGCGGGDARAIAIRWLLADGRTCIDAAVVVVTVTPEGRQGTGTAVGQNCPSLPLADPSILVPAVPPGTRLRGRGLSAGSSVLYRGDLTLPDPVPQTMDMTLYFTGGQ